MPSNTEDREHAQKVIRALLLTKKEGYTLSELLREYQEVEGTPLPWQSFGFMSPLDFIRSMPSTVQVRRSNGTIILKGIASDKTKHISTLVAEQKVECKKKGRKMFRPSHFFPNTAPARVHTPAGILTKLVKLLKEYPDGISKDYALQYIQSYMPSINITMQDMEDQLLSMSHKLIVLNNRICLIQNQTEPASDSHQASKCQFTNLGSSESQNKIKTQPVNHSADREERTVPLPSLMDLELSHPVSDSLSNANFDGMSIKTIDTTIINDRTKFRLEKLIQKEPDGIWCAELPEKYLDAYKVSLNYMEFGFSSVRDFASQLTEIFRVEQPEGGGDFKLYYAKAEKPPAADKDPSKCWEQNNIYDIFNVLNLPEALPSIISSDIVKEIIPEDVMTIGECVGHILVESLTQRDQLYVEVNVVEVFTPTFFWVQLRKAEKLFDEFMNDLHNFYTANQKQYRVPSIVLETGLNCACKYDGRWHRGIIKTVKPDLQVTVMFYDYGTLKTCPAEEIHYLHRTFSHLPAQAIPCGLVNTKPKSGEKWSRRVTHEFALRTSGIPLVATIASYNKTDNSMMVTLTDTLEEDDVHINDWMVEQNFALHGKMDNCVDMQNLMIYVEENLLTLPEKCYDESDSVNDNSASEEEFPLPLVSCLATLLDSSSKSPPGLSRPAEPLNVEHILESDSRDEFNSKRTNPFLEDAAACNQYACSQLTPQSFVELWKQNLQMQMQITEILNFLFTNMMSRPGSAANIVNNEAAPATPHSECRPANSTLGMNNFCNAQNLSSLNRSAFLCLSSDLTLPKSTNNSSAAALNSAPVNAASNGTPPPMSDAYVNNAIQPPAREQAQAPLGLLMAAKALNPGLTCASSARPTSAFTNGTVSPPFPAASAVTRESIEEREAGESSHNETNPFKLSLAGKLRIPEPHEELPAYKNLSDFFINTEPNDGFGHSTPNATARFNERNIENNNRDVGINCQNAHRSQTTNINLPSSSEQYDTVPIVDFEDYRYTVSASAWSANNISDYLAKINIDPSPYQTNGNETLDEFSKDDGASLIVDYIISGEDDEFCGPPRTNCRFDAAEEETEFVSEVGFPQERLSAKDFQRAPTRQGGPRKRDSVRLAPTKQPHEENNNRSDFASYSWSPITGFTSPLLADGLRKSEECPTPESSPRSVSEECNQRSLVGGSGEAGMSAQAWIKSVESSVGVKCETNDAAALGSAEAPGKSEEPPGNRVTDEKLRSFDPGRRAVESSPLSHKLLFQPVELVSNEVAYVFHYRNEGWILTDQFVEIFTGFRTAFYMINLLAMHDVTVPFEELDRDDFLAEFVQLESVLRKYSRSDKEISRIHLMPLISMPKVLDTLGIAAQGDLDKILLNPDCARGTIVHGAAVNIVS